MVLGYRGSNPYVTANDLSVTGEVSTSTLAETIVELRKAVDELVEADEAGESVATERLDQIQAQTTIVDHSYTAPTASGTYVQAEMQDTMDSLESVNDKLNELLVILRTADIVS